MKKETKAEMRAVKQLRTNFITRNAARDALDSDARLRAEVRRLRTLSEYADHTRECSTRATYATPYSCNCGFVELKPGRKVKHTHEFAEGRIWPVAQPRRKVKP